MSASSDRLLDRVLVTNDDGINGPGLAIAEHVAKHVSKEVWTVAPAEDCSGGPRQLICIKPFVYKNMAKNGFLLLVLQLTV